MCDPGTITSTSTVQCISLTVHAGTVISYWALKASLATNSLPQWSRLGGLRNKQRIPPAHMTVRCPNTHSWATAVASKVFATCTSPTPPHPKQLCHCWAFHHLVVTATAHRPTHTHKHTNTYTHTWRDDVTVCPSLSWQNSYTFCHVPCRHRSRRCGTLATCGGTGPRCGDRDCKRWCCLNHPRCPPSHRGSTRRGASRDTNRR